MFKYQAKNLLFILPVLALLAVATVFWTLETVRPLNSMTGNNVVINNIAVSVMIADDLAKQWQGLSDRQFMGSHNGMLFVFPQKSKKAFVMRRMHFPLDIIWIDDDVIVKIDKKLEPEGAVPTRNYESLVPVNRVLEVHGGFTDAFNIKVGDKVTYNLK